MQIEYTLRLWREGSQFVARAMPIDVLSYSLIYVLQMTCSALDGTLGVLEIALWACGVNAVLTTLA